MRSNAGTSNRQGDVDLREAQVSAPQLTLGLAWLAKSISERVICQWHIKKEALQDYIKIVGSTPGCPIMTPRGLGLPLHTVSSRRPTTAPATSCRNSPRPSGQAQPCIKRYTITRGWPDASPRHHTAETPTERTSRFPSGRFFTLHALLQTRTIPRPLSRLQTVQPTLDINKYPCVCVILRFSLRTILQRPTYNWWPRRRTRRTRLISQRDLRITHYTLITFQYDGHSWTNLQPRGVQSRGTSTHSSFILFIQCIMIYYNAGNTNRSTEWAKQKW